MIWTTEKKEQLRKLAAQGLTASQIIEQIDTTLTKNAVVGACHRYGAQLQGGENRKKPARTRPKKWESAPKHEKNMVEKIMARAIGKPPKAVIAKPPKAVIAPPGEPKRIRITTGKLSYTPFSGFNTGTARCMWAGCKNMSISRGKPYCSHHMEQYRKAS